MFNSAFDDNDTPSSEIFDFAEELGMVVSFAILDLAIAAGQTTQAA